MIVKINSRKVQVKGPRGILRRDFSHLQVDIKMPTKKTIIVEKWFGISRELAAVRTVCSHIENMFKGVTKVSFRVQVRTVRRAEELCVFCGF